MKERPIIFSGPMVRAIRADTKRQTRRVVKPPSHQKRYAREVLGIEATNNAAGMAAKACLVRDDWSFCPYGVPGDRLYVKEAAWLWCERQPNGLTRTRRTKWRYEPMRAAGVWYAADHRMKPNISVASMIRGRGGWPAPSRRTLEFSGADRRPLE